MTIRAALRALPLALAALATTPAAAQTLWSLRADRAAAEAQGERTSSSGATLSFAEALNAFRAQNGVGPVRQSAVLNRAAQRYAEMMASTGSFSHTGPDGSTVTTRVRATGCNGRGYFAENIAWGQSSANDAFQGWVARSGHRENMLGRNYGVFGLGQANGYWVLTFADAC
jgi:uncharacterized protein YkwD